MVDFNTIDTANRTSFYSETGGTTKAGSGASANSAVPDSTEQELQALLSELGIPDLPGVRGKIAVAALRLAEGNMYVDTAQIF